MFESIVSDTVGRLFEKTGQFVNDTISSYFGGREILEELQDKMDTIKARVSDAEKLQEGEEGQTIRVLRKRLRREMERSDNLLEEVAVADQQNEQMPPTKRARVVRGILSKLRYYRLNSRVQQEAKSIMSKLDQIKADMDRSPLNVDCFNRIYITVVDSRPRERYIDPHFSRVSTFLKALSATDTMGWLAWPSRWLDALISAVGYDFINFDMNRAPFHLLDPNNRVWHLRCCTRITGRYLKPIIRGEWLQFVRANNLHVGDQVRFYSKRDPASPAHFRVDFTRAS